MYGWERDALGIDTLGEIRSAVVAEMTLQVSGSNRVGWWIATLFGPDFWSHWRVGLLRPTIVATVASPITPPEPLLLGLPSHVGQKFADTGDHMDSIAVCPAILDGKALAFAVAGTTKEEAARGRIEPRERWALVAPSDLTERLKLEDGSQVTVRLLPASHRADPPHGR
jgi:hypothetical protein